jgi:hypothetical protein
MSCLWNWVAAHRQRKTDKKNAQTIRESETSIQERKQQRDAMFTQMQRLLVQGDNCQNEHQMNEFESKYMNLKKSHDNLNITIMNDIQILACIKEVKTNLATTQTRQKLNAMLRSALPAVDENSELMEEINESLLSIQDTEKEEVFGANQQNSQCSEFRELILAR